MCGVATGREVEMTENSEHLFTHSSSRSDKTVSIFRMCWLSKAAMVLWSPNTDVAYTLVMPNIRTPSHTTVSDL